MPFLLLIFVCLNSAMAQVPASNNRLLLWYSKDPAFPDAWAAAWADRSAQIAERHLVLARIDKPADRLKYGIPEHDTEVLLIGKDGEIKRRWPFLPDPREVFALIDSMPMRQREAAEQAR